MTPDQYKRKLRAGLNALQSNREADCTRITLDLLALVRLRVQSEGRNYLEQDFAPYTRDYARERAKAGYQVGYFDFTRTGRAWASVRPETLSITSDTVTIEVASRTAQDRVKFQGARGKRGNILLPSDREIGIAADANAERIIGYFA